MNNLLIINMTRMGDLIQSTPLIAGLRKKYPDAKITMVISSDFEKFAPRIPHIDEFIVFNLRQFNIKNNEGKLKSWIDVYQYLDEFLSLIKEKSYDGAFNLSHSILSALMLAYLKIPKVWGFFCNDVGDRMTFHPWFQYFGIEPFNRTFNPFNLSDIYLRTGDLDVNDHRLEIIVKPEDRISGKNLLCAKGISNSEKIIAFQAGSSLEGRRWSKNSFGRLGDLLIKKFDVKVIFLGVENERAIADEIISSMENKDRAINLAGKTGFSELIGVLQKCSYLVTNDTGTMHLGASLNIPIVGLFFAHAEPVETGPYGEGHLIFQARISCAPCSYGVECNDIACVRMVEPDDVFLFMKEHYDKGYWSKPTGLKAADKINVYLTGFDSDNFLEMKPLLKYPLTSFDIFKRAYHLLWSISLSAYNDIELENLQKLKEIEIFLVEHFDLSKVGIEIDEVKNRILLIQQIANWGAEGIGYSTKIREGIVNGFLNQVEIDRLGNSISDLDMKINQMGLCHSELKPLVDLFSKRKENLCGEDLLVLSVETIECYKKLTQECSRLLFILNRTLDNLSKQYVSPPENMIEEASVVRCS